MTNTTVNTNVDKVLESLILVSLSEIHGISGRKKLKRSDFDDGVDLPPEVIVSLGSKKVIDPKLLNPFTQYKTKAHNLCSTVGIRFLGGYAVPADRVNDLIYALNDVKTEFYIYKRTFLNSDFDSWIDQCEEKYRKILRDEASVDIKYMEDQIQFGFTAIHITPYGNDVIQNGIAGQIKSLTDEVFEEVSGLVEGFLKNLNQTAFSQHTINPLRRTAEKLSSLGFISDSVNKLAVYITDVLADVPVTGKVSGRKYSDILSLLNNLRDPQRAKSFIDLLNTHQLPDSTSTDQISPELSVAADMGLNKLTSNVPVSQFVDDFYDVSEVSLSDTSEPVKAPNTDVCDGTTLTDSAVNAGPGDATVLSDIDTVLPIHARDASVAKFNDEILSENGATEIPSSPSENTGFRDAEVVEVVNDDVITENKQNPSKSVDAFGFPVDDDDSVMFF